MEITRRELVCGVAGALFSPRIARTLSNASDEPYAAPEIQNSELEAMRALANAFMVKNNVPGLSLAVSFQDKLVYTDCFGIANKLDRQKVRTSSLFRIASISKPITSVTIFRLIEQGKLNLNDFVFGESGILGLEYGVPTFKGAPANITIDQLLTHTSGGWENNDADPMFRQQQLDQKKLIAWTLQNRPLEYAPGEHWAYSNFGFCILGRVIEKISGRPYAEFVQTEVLDKCGITDMRIAGNVLTQKDPNEVIYYGDVNDGPYWMNVRRMDSHGGWIATPTDLVNFMIRVDGNPKEPDILKPESIKTMMTVSGASRNYARGWSIGRTGSPFHSGSLPGTTTIAVCTRMGLTWAAFTNTRHNKTSMSIDLDRLLWNMVRSVKAWNA